MATLSAFAGAGAGTGWTNPGNVTGTSNTVYATWVNAARSTVSSPLIASSFGTFAAIPVGATVNSVTVTVWHRETHTAAPLSTVTVQLFAGATGKGPGATALTKSTTARTDTAVYTDVSLAEIQAGTLTAQIVGTRTNSTTSSTVSIDAVQVAVDYTELVTVTLAPADLGHGHTLDAVTVQAISPAVDLIVADLAHTSSVDAAPITQAHRLTTVDLNHTSSIDAVVVEAVAVAVTLAPSDLAHGHTLEPAPITQRHDLTVGDLGHGHTVDPVALSGIHRLTVADLGHPSGVDAVTVTQTHVLAVEDLRHGHSLDSPAAPGAVTLTVSRLTHTHELGAVTVAQTITLTVEDLTTGHTLGTVVITATEPPPVGEAGDTPADRTYTVAAESRTFDAVADVRTFVVTPDDRTLTVPAESRTLTATR